MEITREQTQELADEYLTPLMSMIDRVLLNPDAIAIAEESLKRMDNQMSLANAVAGMMIDIYDVDKRKMTLKTYKAAVELLKVRAEQQEKTVELYRKQGQREQGLREAQQAVGF